MRFYIWILLTVFATNLQAQRTCGTDHLHEQLMETDPEYAKKAKDNTLRRIAAAQKKSLACGGTVSIPVAVHFNDPITCADPDCLLGAVEAQIEVLNEDYSASNADYQNYLDLNAACPASYPLSAAPDQGDGACIEFFLASQNHPPASELCDGDPAITIGLYEWASDAPPWDGYLNIFVDGSQGGLGISWLGGNGDGDGFWVTPTSFGGPGFSCNSGGNLNTSNTYDLGRTATHEAGHYFNLLHVFEGCGGGGDGIPDTNPQSNPVFGNPNVNNCSQVPTQCGGEPENFFSFMDYTDDAGMVMFTVDQSDVQNDHAGGISWASGVSGTYGAVNCGVCNNEPITIELDDSFDPSCNGECDGTIEVEAIGGDGDYTFTIDGNSPNSDGIFENLCDGTYTLLVEDGTGETDEIDVSIFEPEPLTVDVVDFEDVLCFGEMTGVVELNISGGTEDYAVELNGDNFGDDTFISGLAANTYDIIVTDENGCEAITSVTINQPTELTASIVTQTDPVCFGYDDGTVDLMASGGTVNYMYSADGVTFQPSANFVGLSSGNYNFVIEDGNGCTVVVSVSLTDPPPIEILVSNITDQLDCFGDQTGTISIEGSNTTPPYNYSIDGMTYTGSGDFSDLGAGDYTLYVQDGNDCINTVDLSIDQPEELEFFADIEVPVSCNGEADGIVFLDVTGGTSNYNYYLEDFTMPVSNTVDDLGPGTYNFIVVDANGCEITTQAELTEPEAIEINTINIQEVECFGDETGAANFDASGGSGAYVYAIGTNENNDGVFTNMTSGTYTLVVTDDNGCSEELIFDIGQTSTLLLDVTIDSDNACAGDQSGAFTLQGMGGNGNYQYSLDGVNFSSQNTFSGLDGGIYDVFVIDDNDCITINSAIISEPETIVLEPMQIGEILCNGDETGILSIDAQGGAGSFTYTLGSESNMTGIFMNLGSGSFMVNVTDINGCSNQTEFTIDEPTEILSGTLDITNNSCEGQQDGSVTAAASGGVAPLSYELNGNTNNTGIFTNVPGGSFTLLITDANSCTISQAVMVANDIDLSLSLVNAVSPTCNDTQDGLIAVTADGGNGNYSYTLGGETNMTGIFENLIAGEYTVLVFDPVGCTTSIEVEILAAALINLDQADVTDVLCNGEATGSVQLNADGGTGELTFELNGETNTDGVFENLPAGDYDLTVMDSNGCESTSMISITEPEAIVVNSSSSNFIDCFGESTGAIDIDVSGGIGDLSYSINGQGANDSGSFDNLPAGTYDVVISDQNGCDQVETITIDQSPEIQTDIVQINHVDCNGNATGMVELNSVGGDGNHTYFLDGVESQIGAFVSLSGGTYTVDVVDNLGCETSFVFEIEEPNALMIEPTVVDATGDMGGSINVNPIGGTAPYDIMLEDGTTADIENNFNDLAEGFYTVIVSDSEGCMTELEIEIRLENLYDMYPEGITINEVLCPNPAKDIMILKFEATSDQWVVLDFFDDIGQYIKYQSYYATTGENTIEIDISDLASAGYIMRVKSAVSFKHLKFIKID